MKTILFVEDYKDLLELLKEKFEGEGYEVISFERGRECINFVEKGGSYDLAIIDLGLPDIYGGRVIKKLKKLNPNLPVFSYSGDDNKPIFSDKHIDKWEWSILEKAVKDYFDLKD